MLCGMKGNLGRILQRRVCLYFSKLKHTPFDPAFYGNTVIGEDGTQKGTHIGAASTLAKPGDILTVHQQGHWLNKGLVQTTRCAAMADGAVVRPVLRGEVFSCTVLCPAPRSPPDPAVRFCARFHQL